MLHLDESEVDAAEARLLARSRDLHRRSSDLRTSIGRACTGSLTTVVMVAATAAVGIGLGLRRPLDGVGKHERRGDPAPDPQPRSVWRTVIFALATPWMEKLIARAVGHLIGHWSRSRPESATAAESPVTKP